MMWKYPLFVDVLFLFFWENSFPPKLNYSSVLFLPSIFTYYMSNTLFLKNLDRLKWWYHDYFKSWRTNFTQNALSIPKQWLVRFRADKNKRGLELWRKQNDGRIVLNPNGIEPQMSIPFVSLEQRDKENEGN